MQSVFTGPVFVVRDNIDTDQIISAQYLNLVPTIAEEYEKLGSYALDGLPASLSVSDHTGTFTNYDGPLTLNIEAYATPVNRRAAKMPNAAEFADVYLAAFVERFEHTQQTYRQRRRAFDSIFKHRPWDPNGSLAYRWFHVLARLDAADASQIIAAIRSNIRLPPAS